MFLRDQVEKERLQQFRFRFQSILASKTISIKSARLAILQDDMEQVFDIPMIGKENAQQFRNENPEMMLLYRQVVNERDSI